MEGFLERRTQVFQQPVFNVPDWQQLQQLHRMPSSGNFIGLQRSATPAIFLQLVIKRDAINIEYVGRMALIASAVREHTQDMSALNIFQRLAVAVGNTILLEDEILLSKLRFLSYNHGALDRVL